MSEKEVRAVRGILLSVGGGRIVIDVLGREICIKAEQHEERQAGAMLYKYVEITAADHGSIGWWYKSIAEVAP